MKSFGFSGDFNVLVMELLGDSLESLFEKQHKKLSLKTTCMLGIQMIDLIEWVHSKYILHRDIKPDNFVIGIGDKAHIVYVIDFGLSKKYWNANTNTHIKFSINKKLTGTARYASVNALRGCEQSRRDDLEAIGYVLMYFLRGSLPWQGLKIDKKDDRYKKIYEKKKATSPEELCSGFPNELCEYIKYTRHLDFEAKPDYIYLKGLLKNIMMKNSFEFDFYYDWCTEKPVIAVPSIEAASTTDVSENKERVKTEENVSNNRMKDIFNNFETNEAQYNMTVPNEEKDKKKKKTKKDKNCIVF